MSQTLEPAESPRGEPVSMAVAATSQRRPWVTWCMTAACVAVFLGLNQEPNPDAWETYGKWGAPSSLEIWGGAYWGLLTCTVVHRALWHLAFNLYWLWILGTRLERAIGSGRYLLFVLAAGVVSSGTQLGSSGETGIGASGIVYAVFGFMMVAKNRFIEFREFVSQQTIQWFLLWLLGCMWATYVGVWRVGNAAHLGGLLFGSFAAGCFAIRYKPRLLGAALVLLVATSLVPLFWCPRSVAWLSMQAFQATEEGDFETAITYFDRILELDPNYAWAYHGRGLSYLELGDRSRAEPDLKKASQLDPRYQMPKELETKR